MEKDTFCKYCNEKFKQIDAPLFANHVRWCKKNPNDTISNIGSGVNFAINNKLGEYKDFSVSCFRCSVKFIVREREKMFPKKSKYFCTRSCANTRIHTEETKEKMKKVTVLLLNYYGKIQNMWQRWISAGDAILHQRLKYSFVSIS